MYAYARGEIFSTSFHQLVTTLKNMSLSSKIWICVLICGPHMSSDFLASLLLNTAVTCTLHSSGYYYCYYNSYHQEVAPSHFLWIWQNLSCLQFYFYLCAKYAWIKWLVAGTVCHMHAKQKIIIIKFQQVGPNSEVLSWHLRKIRREQCNNSDMKSPVV